MAGASPLRRVSPAPQLARPKVEQEVLEAFLHNVAGFSRIEEASVDEGNGRHGDEVLSAMAPPATGLRPGQGSARDQEVGACDLLVVYPLTRGVGSDGGDWDKVGRAGSTRHGIRFNIRPWAHRVLRPRQGSAI